MSDTELLAEAIACALNDENDENIVDAVNRLARAITNLGNADAATPMGGMEALGKAMQDSANSIESGMESIATAINNLTDAIDRSRTE